MGSMRSSAGAESDLGQATTIALRPPGRRRRFHGSYLDAHDPPGAAAGPGAAPSAAPSAASASCSTASAGRRREALALLVVAVEPAPGLAAQPPGRDEVPEVGRRSVL